MPDIYEIFQRFENYKSILENEIPLLRNYICGNLVSWSPNFNYYESIYNEFSQLYLVIEWRKRHNFFPLQGEVKKLLITKYFILGHTLRT